MSPRPLVWVTRVAPGARTTAERVRTLGLRAVAAPLLALRPLHLAPPDLDGIAALAFTSAAGVRGFARLTSRRDRPVFTVGGATAAVARLAGWADVTSADGAGRELAERLAAAQPPGPVLAPGAREPAFDLAAALAPAGVEVRALPVYATERADPPPRRALRLLAAGRLAAVLLHSPAATRALAAAVAADAQPHAGTEVAGGERETPAPRPRLLGLSPACLPGRSAPGPLADWPAVAAAAPRERDLLALLLRLDTPAPLR